MGDPDHHPPAHGRGRRAQRRPRRRGGKGCLAVLIALVVLVGGGWFALDQGISALRDRFGAPEDYPGPGQGQVLVEVHEGDSAADIGNTLKEQGVVASVDAFTAAAKKEPASTGIQVGFYQLMKQMRAADALALLIEPANLIKSAVTIPEGFTVEQTIARIAEQTDFPAKEVRRIVAQRAGLGLPAYAQGNPEGYLFPSTYTVTPDMKAPDLLRQMVAQFRAQAAPLVRRAGEAGLSEHDLMTVASIVQKEVRRPEDMPAVAEVIRNRLDGSCAPEGVPTGLLQMDSTVHYIEGSNDSVFTTDEMRASESAYNTYRAKGLPPGPIAAPGVAALEASLNPTDDGWCFFVAVDLESGETAFARTGAEHEANAARLRTWCADHPDFAC